MKFDNKLLEKPRYFKLVHDPEYQSQLLRRQDGKWVQRADHEAVLAELIRLRGEVERMQANDGRPCSMDVFVGQLFEDCDDHYGRGDAIKAWLEGDWAEALGYIDDPDSLRSPTEGSRHD